MTVRRLRKKQRGPWCSYCDDKKTRAIHRGVHFTKFACSDHLSDLEKDDQDQERRDSHMTEADYQTWGRL